MFSGSDDVHKLLAGTSFLLHRSSVSFDWHTDVAVGMDSFKSKIHAKGVCMESLSSV